MASAKTAFDNLFNFRAQLQSICNDISCYEPPLPKPPILDSSIDLNDAEHKGSSNTHESIPGLRVLKDEVKRDLCILEKFLEDDQSKSGPALSTNAPYLIAVWHEVLCAPHPIIAIYRTFFAKDSVPSGKSRRIKARRDPGVKVDVVADNGKQWIRINTIKNSRILAEFREIDSYLTSSDSDSDEVQEISRSSQNQFDNSVLRMGRALVAAARDNPIAGTAESPRVTLSLTRLDPCLTGESGDPRIAKTIQILREMGINVLVGERTEVAVPPRSIDTSSLLEPTACVNLDLSTLVALVSDITHSHLPTSEEEAHARFVPPLEYRQWKKQRMQRASAKGKQPHHPPTEDLDDDTWNFDTHSRALANQVRQEMQRGLLEEMRDRVCSASPLEKVEFWTTAEARERCLRIVSKIGGIREQQRARALFPPYLDGPQASPMTVVQDLEHAYWEHSRYPPRFLLLLPIRIFHSDPGHELRCPNSMPGHFCIRLAQTCENLLSQDSAPPLFRAQKNGDDVHTSDDEVEGEIGRAAVIKTNSKLTTHTVQSLLVGATRGWTTLTANRSSVKAILKEMKPDAVVPAVSEDSTKYDNRAAIWIVDPRSLAEGMRSDCDVAS